MQSEILEGFRLSPQQKCLWSLQHDAYSSSGSDSAIAYRAQCSICLEGLLDAEVLKKALHKLVERHEILRTTFHRRPGIRFPIQVITDSPTLSWHSINLSNLEVQDQSVRIEQVFQQERQWIFDFERRSLFRVCLLTLSCDRHILLVTLPSLYADSWTLKNLVQEISQAYALCLNGEEFSDEPIQYIQFSEWQNDLLGEEDALAGKIYWQKQNLASISAPILPFEGKSSRQTNFAPDVHALTIEPDLVAKIEKNVAQNHTTAEFLLACWKTLIWRLTQQSDIVINTVFNGRNYEELQNALGLLAKPLPVCCSFQDNFKFCEVLSRIGEAVCTAEKWQDYFIGEENTKSNGEVVDFPIGFEFEEWFDKYSAGGVSFSVDRHYVCFERFKVKLNCIRRGESLTAEFHYNPELIEKESIKCLAEQFHTLVESAANNPEATVSELKILSDRTRHQLLVEFHKTQTNYSQNQCIHHLFEQQVERTPDNIAVVFEDQQLTYAELNTRANKLAHYLQKLGVGPDVLVGICLERSLEIVIAMLGILKAGGSYLPLDPALPTEGLAFRLQDVQVPILLTQQLLVEKLPKNLVQVICLDTDWEVIDREDQENPHSEVKPEHLVYALFTSGSTGKPKGVAIEHQQLINYLHGILDRLNLPGGASFATVSTFAADLGNTVIFPALCTGGCLHVISQERASDPTALGDYVQRHPIDCLKIVPSHLAALLTGSASQFILPRQCLVLGGEAASWNLIEKLQQYAPTCRILNHYGPTETTVGVLTYAVESQQASYNAKTVPIGRAIANTQVYLLDETLQPVPIGVPGELYIGGAGLARGYLNRPELTAQRFIPHPFVEGARLYKTGDMARYLPDGNIEFLGRCDRQVKIRGFRIELGEIETVLVQHPEVLQAVVVERQDHSGNNNLVAYVVPKAKQSLSSNTLRHFLKEKLPEYMMPSAFAMLKSLPLTRNGKVDFHALPAPDQVRSTPEKSFVAPRTATEQHLSAIWAEILEMEQVGIHDNFFELGGHSLQAIQLVSKISVAMNLEFSVKLLFVHPTIAELADAIESLVQKQKLPQPVSSPNPLVQTESTEKRSQPTASPFFQIERRSLLSLLATGKIAPVDAVALGYLNIDLANLEARGLSRDDIVRDWFDDLPVVTAIVETHWGRIANLTLPRFSVELYSDQKDIVDVTVEALEIAGRIGARTVSLTGLIPSATDYGRAIAQAISDRNDLPAISTGHATTSAAVVLSIARICSESGRDLAQERVGFIGLGSVGISSLRLMLKSLPHPQEITLCDVYNKLKFLEGIRQEITNDFGFQGNVRIVASQTEVPPEIYDTSLIVGATNAPDVLDITQVKPGTLIVDDSAPHCFTAELAIQRFQEQEDILFTEGGNLRSPHPFTRLRYLPRHVEKSLSSSEVENFLNGNPFNITGCVFSGLLSSRFEHLKPTVGEFDWKMSIQHYKLLNDLGFQSADLHCGDYVLPETSILNFKHRFSNS